MAYLNFSQMKNSTLSSIEMEREPGTVYVVLAPVLVFIMLLAIFGNMTLIITICRNRRLRTRTNMFILNQACADVGVALFCMPFSIVTCYTREWIFGESMCQLNGFVNILFEASSLFTLTAISIEKYFSLVMPMTVVITTKMTCTMVSMTWFTALGLATLPLTGFIAFEFKSGSTQCGVQTPANLGQTVYAFVVLLVAFLMPLCIMGFCYINIFRAVRKHNIRLSRMSLSSIDSNISLSTQSQIALTIFIMLVAFVICWSPYFAYMMYMTARHVKSANAFARNLGLASYWFAFLNSCINPFVYGIRNPLIRRALISMCCSRRFRDNRGRSSLRKTHEYCDSYLGPPQPSTNCDKTSPPHLAFINVVALSEEDIVSPNEGIGKLTVDRGTQTGTNWQILSIQDLPDIYFANEPYFLTNQAVSRSFTTLPLQSQEIFADYGYDVTCSTCSSACSDSDHVVTNSIEEVTCSSESSVQGNSLCSDCESDCESLTSKSCSQCDQDDIESNSGWSLSNLAKEAHCHDIYHHVHAKKRKKSSFLFPEGKTSQKFKIGWMESQL